MVFLSSWCFPLQRKGSRLFFWASYVSRVQTATRFFFHFNAAAHRWSVWVLCAHQLHELWRGSPSNESKLLQLWPHRQPWCHASLQLIAAHAELRAWFCPPPLSSRQVHHPWLKPPLVVRHSRVHLWNHGLCLTGILNTAPTPQPCLVQSRNDYFEYWMLTYQGIHIHVYRRPIKATRNRMQWPRREPDYNRMIQGGFVSRSCIRVFQQQKPRPCCFRFSIPSSPTCWKDTNMVCLSSVPVRICRFVGLTGYSELNTTECSKTYGWKYDDWLAGCLCSTADYMQMSGASLLFLCRIGRDCDLFLINWTAEWLDDKGSQHYSFSFFLRKK